MPIRTIYLSHTANAIPRQPPCRMAITWPPRSTSVQPLGLESNENTGSTLYGFLMEDRL